MDDISKISKNEVFWKAQIDLFNTVVKDGNKNVFLRYADGIIAAAHAENFDRGGGSNYWHNDTVRMRRYLDTQDIIGYCQ